MALKLEIITPDEVVFTSEVDSAVVPTTSGELGILPGHVPLMSQLTPGEVEVKMSGERERLAVDKGFVRIMDDTISLLTEAAIDVAKIDLSAVEEAEKRAEQALEEAKNAPHDLDPVEIERLEAITRFAVIQKIAKNKKL